ncbi:MAG: hypothetical protein AAFV53_15090 [Myxococcota bacterium]
MWEIRSPRIDRMVVEAPNWLAALGEALSRLGTDEGMERLACECLRNGLIIAHDLSRRERYTVRAVAGVRLAPDDALVSIH